MENAPLNASPPKMNAGPLDFSKEEKEEMKEFSIFHQAVFLYRRQDQFLNECEDLHCRAAGSYQENGDMLIACYNQYKHAIKPTIYAMNDLDEKAIRNKMKKFADIYNKEITENKKITQATYSELHGLIDDMIDLLYEGNQKAGMGMPKEMKISRVRKIREMMG